MLKPTSVLGCGIPLKRMSAVIVDCWLELATIVLGDLESITAPSTMFTVVVAGKPCQVAVIVAVPMVGPPVR